MTCCQAFHGTSSEAQGYSVDHNIDYQDNKSAILLETNENFSSSNRTNTSRPVTSFIKEKIVQGDVELEYCPTEEIWCDVLTNPKQGKAFRKDRAMLMNCPFAYEDDDSNLENIDEVKGVRKRTGVLWTKSRGSGKKSYTQVTSPMKT